MSCEIIEGDCLAVMRGMADNSFDAIVTDPPYFKVKGEAWDRQWDKPTQFLAWMGDLCEQWQRLLKPNGSLYVFASPQMAWAVEGEVRRLFAVLNRIRWQKLAENIDRRHLAQIVVKDLARCYLPACEEIIFAEHYGADNIAKGEAGYVAKCDELRGFVFEPLRAYIAGEWQRAGLTARDANEATGTQMAGHYLTQTQWALPTEANYEKLRHYANRNGGEYLRREYEDLRREYEDLRREYEDLRREYEDLRREYEDLRRPFSVTADVPYTDVWTFPTVQHYKGKHPCEKPLAMMEHIIRASTKPDAAVLDCFAGSGSTGVACRRLGRDFVGIELDADYAKLARARIAAASGERFAPPEKRPEPPPLDDLPLFRNLGPAA